MGRAHARLFIILAVPCWYFGGSLDQVNLHIPGRSVEMDGVQFNEVNASADRAGIKIYGGYWITEHMGIEVGAAS